MKCVNNKDTQGTTLYDTGITQWWCIPRSRNDRGLQLTLTAMLKVGARRERGRRRWASKETDDGDRRASKPRQERCDIGRLFCALYLSACSVQSTSTRLGMQPKPWVWVVVSRRGGLNLHGRAERAHVAFFFFFFEEAHLTAPSAAHRQPPWDGGLRQWAHNLR